MHKKNLQNENKLIILKGFYMFWMYAGKTKY